MASGKSMRRREFIRLVGGGGAAVAWPLPLSAQQAMPVIGYLNSASPGNSTTVVGFRQGLKETGFIEGQNVTVEYRWADGQYDRLPLLAADLVRRQVAVIFANTASAPVAKAATTTIPIVFQVGSDPVKDGLVASLNRPGGNLTGVVSLNAEVGPKRLELLHELVPAAAIIALLVNPANPITETLSSDAQAAAHTIGLQLHVLHVRNERDIDDAFGTLVQLGAGALVIGADAFLSTRSEQLAALAVRYAVPTISPYRTFTAAGGLMSYGGSNTDAYHLAGVYTGRILKGEKPAELPVQQATKVELVINLKTAKALGLPLPLPLPLLGRADEVIE
jgi:putative tryptophan/tyrosine transport system substrate-binding protein